MSSSSSSSSGAKNKSPMTNSRTTSNFSHFFSKLNNNNGGNNSNNSILGPNNYKCNSTGCQYDKDKDDVVSAGSNPTNAGTKSSGQSATSAKCAGCRKVIKEKYLLKALDQLWHEDCLKCSCCDCRLGEVGSTLFTKANLLLCRRDYLRLFGTTGYCSACSKMIPAFEMVMKAKNNVYHLECFACQQCSHRFCVGDRYFLCDNKILCEYDYEERLLIAKASFDYAAYSQSLPHGSSYSSNFIANNGVTGSQYVSNEANFSFQSSPFFSTPPTFGGGNVSTYNYPQFPPYQHSHPTTSAALQNVTRLNSSDDISSGYGSPSPSST